MMGSMWRCVPFALALLAVTISGVHAAPFDGTENAGTGCLANYATELDDDVQTGVIWGGPWVAADLIQNNGGILDVDSRAGAATDMRITCMLRAGNTGAIVVSTSSAVPGTGIVYLPPRVFAYTAPDSTFTTCTVIEWTDTRGNPSSLVTC